MNDLLKRVSERPGRWNPTEASVAAPRYLEPSHTHGASNPFLPWLTQALFEQVTAGSAAPAQEAATSRSQRAALQAAHQAVETLRAESQSALAALEKRLQASQASLGERKSEAQPASRSLAQCNATDTRFRYLLTPSGRAADMPMSLIQSDPASLLAVAFDGRYGPPKDTEGRIELTCSPATWEQTVSFLAYEAIAPGPQPELLAFARHWQLGRLIERLEARVPGLVLTENRANGALFSAKCTFANVGDWSWGGVIWLEFVAWTHGVFAIEIGRRGVSLSCRAGGCSCNENYFIPKTIKYDFQIGRRDQDSLVFEMTHRFDLPNSTWGCNWPDFGLSFDEIRSEQFALYPDSLVLTACIYAVEEHKPE